MWLSEDELNRLGFGAIGSHVLIDETVLLQGVSRMYLGSRIRIDSGSDLTASSGSLRIGNNVHLGHAVHIYAGADVDIKDFAGLAAGVRIFSMSDDYSGGALTNPTVPARFRDVSSSPVMLGRHVIVGSGSVILPGARIGDGAAIGALTLVHRSVPARAVVSGNPMRRVGTRDWERICELETEYLQTRDE